MYDLLTYLLDKPINAINSAQIQGNFFKAITTLKIIILNLKNDITDQSAEQKKKIFAKQENVLSNAEILLEKRNDLIDQFSKNNIISVVEKFYGAPKKSEESISEKLEQESDQSFPKWVQVSKDRFDFIKLKINKNKNFGKNNAIKEYNNLVNKAEKIAKLRSTEPRHKMMKIFIYLEEIFNGPTTKGDGLKILTPNQMLSR